jgi:peptidylprolyl isomerase
MPRRIAVIILSILSLSVLLITGCGGSKVAQTGDIVKVNYTGTLSDGTVFDSSVGRTPLQFTVGDGKMIAGFDKAVIGMKVGESKKVTLTPDEAYGQRNENLIQVVNKSQLPDDLDPKVGDKLQVQTPGGTLVVTVTAVTDTTFTVDGNHELAGKDLTFEITMVEITKKK